MKTPILLSTCALLSAGTAFAAVTFSSPPYGVSLSPIDGVDGWTQSEANVASDAPLFYVYEQGGSRYGYLSGYYAAPDASLFTVSRDFANPSTLQGSTLSFDAAIIDSTNDYPDRNDFGMTVSVGATDLLTLSLTPESQSATPISNSSNWALNYQFNGGSQTATGWAAVPSSLVTYEIDFTATGIEVKVGAGVGPTTTFSATPAGYTPASTDDVTVSFFWDQGPGADFGDNGLLIDGIDLVPEPSSASLVLFGVMGLVLRRRR